MQTTNGLCRKAGKEIARGILLLLTTYLLPLKLTNLKTNHLKTNAYEKGHLEVHHSDGHCDFDRYRHHARSNRVHGSRLILKIEH